MSDEFDPFAVDSGLPSGFIGAISKPEFKVDADGTPDDDGNYPTILSFDNLPTDPEVTAFVQKVKVGSSGKWVPIENGRKVAREDGKIGNFHQNSGIGTLVSYAVKTEAGDLMKDYFTKTGLSPFDADFWEGWVFKWERVKFESNSKDFPDYERLLPVEFVNAPAMNSGPVNAPVSAPVVPSAPVSAPAPVQAPAPQAPPTPAPAPAQKSISAPAPANGQLIDGIPAATYQGIYGIAYNAADFNSYVEQAYKEYGAQGAEVMAVIDNQTENGVWARAATAWNEANAVTQAPTA